MPSIRGGYIRRRLFLWRDASQPAPRAVPSRSLARAETRRRAAHHVVSPPVFDRNDAVAALWCVAREIDAANCLRSLGEPRDQDLHRSGGPGADTGLRVGRDSTSLQPRRFATKCALSALSVCGVSTGVEALSADSGQEVQWTLGIVFADLGEKALRNWRTWLYVGSSAFVALVCLARPLSDDFDRYIYEALVRGKHESVERIYPLIKHESPRAEASSVLDSAEHLAQLEPLYAIRPLYIEIISIVNLWLPIQRSINLVSAFSLFGMALVLAIWTKKPLYCALLVTTAAIVDIGRMGTPDALSVLFVIAGFWLLERNQIGHGILLLLASVWVRTDNLLWSSQR